MKMVKDKKLVVGADFAGYPLKEAVVAHLKAKGWEITDMGVKADSDPDDTDLMFHRVGLRVGAMISEGEFERALLFCGTGMGIHIAASKCPHVHAGVVESVPAALRAITGNGVTVLALGACYVAPAWVATLQMPTLMQNSAVAMNGGRTSTNSINLQSMSLKNSTMKNIKRMASRLTNLVTSP